MSEVPEFQSDTGHSTAESIQVHGFDLTEELMGELDLGEMVYLVLRKEKPPEAEAELLNAILLSLVEHGLTPSAVASRLTYLGEPESLQGAVASGLLGVGSQFVGTTENTAQFLQTAMEKKGDKVSIRELAKDVVREFRERNESIPGLGHPTHEPRDPRTVTLFEMAEELDLVAEHTKLMEAIRDDLADKIGKTLPINVTGAIGSLLSDMGFSWDIVRSFSVISRCVGLVGHIQEEQTDPMAMDLWDFLEEQNRKSNNTTNQN